MAGTQAIRYYCHIQQWSFSLKLLSEGVKITLSKSPAFLTC